MIIELVGPSSSGKTTLIDNLKDINNYDFVFRKDFKTNNPLYFLKISNLKTIYTTYKKIFLLKELSFNNKLFYSKHLSKKIIFINSSNSDTKFLIPDEGLISIYLSILSIYKVSILEIVQEILNENSYICIFINVDTETLKNRLQERGFPEGWEKRNIFNNSNDKYEKFFQIKHQFKLHYLALKEKKEINTIFFEIDNNHEIDLGIKNIVSIINNI